MESMVYEKRPQYYEALQVAQRKNDSSEFIEFSLSAILETVEAQEKHKEEHIEKHTVEQLSSTMISVLRALEYKSLSRKEIFDAIGMSNDFRAFKRNIEPLITNGFVETTVSNKPSSKLQKYRLTDTGKGLISSGNSG